MPAKYQIIVAEAENGIYIYIYISIDSNIKGKRVCSRKIYGNKQLY